MSKLPLKTVKRIIKDNVKGEVCGDAVIFARDFVEGILIELARASCQKLEEENRYRKIQGLPELKRIPHSIFLKLSNRIFKQTPDINDGETGQHNSDTVLSTNAVEVA